MFLITLEGLHKFCALNERSESGVQSLKHRPIGFSFSEEKQGPLKS